MATAAAKPKKPATRPTAPAQPTALQTAHALMQEFATLSAQCATIVDKAKKEAEPITNRLKELEAQLCSWASDAANAREFGGNKLLKTEWGQFGFRAGTKKLKWNADSTPEGYQEQVIKVVRKLLPTAIIEKVDDTKVAKLWDDTPKLAAALSELGGFVEQLDNFTIILPKAKA